MPQKRNLCQSLDSRCRGCRPAGGFRDSSSCLHDVSGNLLDFNLLGWSSPSLFFCSFKTSSVCCSASDPRPDSLYRIVRLYIAVNISGWSSTSLSFCSFNTSYVSFNVSDSRPVPYRQIVHRPQSSMTNCESSTTERSVPTIGSFKASQPSKVSSFFQAKVSCRASRLW